MGLTKVSSHILDANLDLGTIEVSTVQVGSGTTIHTTGIDLGNGNLTSHNINSTGIITASSFVGPLTGTASNATVAQGLTGTPNITVTDITANGNVSIAGTLTYEDVTNIDSVGLITARSGIDSKDYSLSAISSSISDTAVDVFVYDTSKDSDGGAWRKRTQHTSWYNETLGTATRGTRREFPAVAVIVVTAATTRKLYIYDGDDPDLPMWMVIDTTDGQWPQTEFSSLYALNGIIALGSSSNTQPLYETRNRLDLYYFVSDKIESSGEGTSGNYYGTVEGLVNRRTHATHKGSPTGKPVYDLVNRRVNDVAITVLPNAPIDDATGLPTPTIAVATDGGVSVIKHDGTVVDINRTSDDDVHHVAFDGNRVIMFMELGAIYVATIPSADQSGNPNSAWTVYGSYGGNTSGTDHPAVQAYGAGVDLVSMKDHTFATAGFNNSNNLYKGLSILSENVNSSGNGMAAWIRSDCNTGWMHGDIKGAFLSDTDDTNVTGSELVTNGTFDSDTSNWTAVAGATLSVSSNRLVVTGDGSTAGAGAAQSFTTVSGKKYVLTYVAYAGSINVGQVRIGTGANAYDITFDNSVNSNAYDAIYFTAVGTTTFITFGVNAGVVTSGSFQYDNISVKEVEEDRSVNNKGLQVFGTVTKTAVATGAELVGYSFGDSNANYLKQPANLDFQFGTGDFSVMAWIKMPDYSQTGFIFDRSDSGGNERIAWYMEGDDLKFYTYDGANHSEIGLNTVEIGSGYDGQWVHCVATRHSSGLLEEYINGVLIHSQTATVRQINNEDAYMVVGGRYNNASGNEFNGSIALLRISGSIPSAEQVKKMYEDEKMLFQENAACTLYGSSDAVNALAFDDTTKLLHVGTSSGRSDFQGLCRINNTTTAVTTAISASDDLIAEQ